MNINHFIRNNQRTLLFCIATGIVIVMTLLWWINKQASATETPSTKQTTTYEKNELPEPDLTGAITNTFDSKVQTNLLTDTQLREKENRQTLDKLLKEIRTLQQNFNEVKNENSQLTTNLKQLQTEIEKNKDSDNTLPSPWHKPTEKQNIITILPPEGQIESTRFHYPQKENSPSSGFYVPSGTFSTAIVLEGADANASVRGETKMVPMQFKLTGLAHLPGNQKLDKLTHCFVTAAAYGEISSERAEVRLQRLSCVIDNQHIDQPVKGHAAFYGKNGIKGIPVMRNGTMLGLAFGAGALGGLGNAFSQIGNTTVGIGAAHQTTSQDVARQALGSGASAAANKLADYYIERAEQYHPVIPIGAANRVEIVFQEGFKAEFIEDKARQTASQSSTAPPKEGINKLQTGLPPELVNQLGSTDSLDLSDFVTPSNPKQP